MCTTVVHKRGILLFWWEVCEVLALNSPLTVVRCVQLGQGGEGDEQLQIFTPTDGNTWRIAKACFEAADFMWVTVDARRSIDSLRIGYNGDRENDKATFESLVTPQLIA